MMKKVFFTILSVVVLLLSGSFTTLHDHKYYLSLTNIEHNKDSNSLEIITNVFMDDIELALNDIHNIDLQLTTERELKDNDIFFKDYFRKKIKIRVNNLQKELTYLGKEYEGDLVYLYLEIKDITDIKTLELSNTILIEHFEDQQNLIKAKVNGTSKSKVLNSKIDKALLKF